jgi:hypothetical protein
VLPLSIQILRFVNSTLSRSVTIDDMNMMVNIVGPLSKLNLFQFDVYPSLSPPKDPTSDERLLMDSILIEEYMVSRVPHLAMVNVNVSLWTGRYITLRS